MTAKYPTIEDYVRSRDNDTPLPQFESSFAEAKQTVKPSTEEPTGEPLIDPPGDLDDYKKVLDFLKGRKNIPDGNLGEKPNLPKEAPKGWFVVDEVSKGFWADGGWTQDTYYMEKGIFESEKAAHELARVVGGVVIPAEEVL